MRSLMIVSLAILATVSASPASANAEVQTAKTLNSATEAAIAQSGKLVCNGSFCVMNTGVSMLYGEDVVRHMQSRTMLSRLLSNVMASMSGSAAASLVNSIVSPCSKKCGEDTVVTTTE